MEKQCNNIKCVKHNECSGCGSCSNKCPFDAISMQYDEQGFLFPVIDEEKCTNCGLCKKACPALDTAYPNTNQPKVYAAWAKDEIRMSCSSGGIFSVMAERIVTEDGYVCGAAFNDKVHVEHIITNDKEGLERIKESKYIPSEMKDSYRQIEKLLKDGKTVLFGGCPCQAAGLRKYLGKEYENLYIIDVLCTGGISNLVWDKYLNEFHGGKEIYRAKFRDKNVYGWVHSMHIRFKDGTRYFGPKGTDPFYRIFMKKLAFRESCGECKYANVSRQGDITLGDFWGVYLHDRSLDDGRGTSIVTINNEKGTKLFEMIKDELARVQEVPLEFLMKRGQPFQSPKKPDPKRERFMELLPKYSLEKAYKYALEDRYDVGIVGLWWPCNYGSLMTYYSLMKVIQSMGLSTIMIDRPGLDLENNHGREFAKKHFEAISEAYPFPEWWQHNAKCDAFVMGSDQVWNFGISEKYQHNFFLGFADDEKKKVAYAASFGFDRFDAPRHEVDAHRELLARFDAISVREDSAVDVLKNTFGVKGTQVLDSVFIVDPKEIDAIRNESKAKVDGPYIATYILDPTEEKRKAILHIAEQKKLKLVNMLDGVYEKTEENKEKLQLDVIDGLEVQDWLYYISNCEYFITDSCHGASFAMLYKKPFVCIGNPNRGLTRFESLFRLMKLEKRLVPDANDILNRPDLLEPIDYEPVYKILNKQREFSRKWFEEALFCEKSDSSYRFYPYADSRITGRKYPQVYKRKSSLAAIYHRALIFYKEHVQKHVSADMESKIRKVLRR